VTGGGVHRDDAGRAIHTHAPDRAIDLRRIGRAGRADRGGPKSDGIVTGHDRIADDAFGAEALPEIGDEALIDRVRQALEIAPDRVMRGVDVRGPHRLKFRLGHAERNHRHRVDLRGCQGGEKMPVGHPVQGVEYRVRRLAADVRGDIGERGRIQRYIAFSDDFAIRGNDQIANQLVGGPRKDVMLDLIRGHRPIRAAVGNHQFHASPQQPAVPVDLSHGEPHRIDQSAFALGHDARQGMYRPDADWFHHRRTQAEQDNRQDDQGHQ